MNEIWNTILNTGVQKHLTEQERIRIKFLNMMSTVTICGCVIYMIMHLYVGDVWFVLTTLSASFWAAFIIFLNKQYKYVVARYCGIISYFGTLFLFAYLCGRVLQLEYVMVFLPLYAQIFSASRKQVLGVSIIGIITFILFKTIYHYTTPVLEVSYPFVCQTINAFILMFIAFWVIKVYKRDIDEILLNNAAKNEALKQEIDDRRKVEQAFLDSETRYRLLFEKSPVGIVVRKVASSNWMNVNEQFAKILGYQPQELAGMDRATLTEWEDPDVYNKKIKRLLKGEIDSFKVEKQFKRKDGGTVWCNSTRSLMNVDGETYVIGFVEDISEQKKTLLALADSESKYKSIFNNTTDGIVIYDFDKSELVDFNDVMLEMFKTTREGMYASTALTFTPEFQSDGRPTGEAFADLMAITQQGKTVHSEWTHCRSDGTLMDCDVIVTPLYYDVGRNVWLSMIRNITERKRANRLIKENETRLKEAQKLAKMGNWEYEFGARKILWSEETLRIFEMEGLPSPTFDEYLKLVHPKDLPNLRALVEKAYKKGEPYETEIRFFTRTKRLINVIAKGIPKEVDGKIARLFGTIQDITEQKKRTDELAYSLSLLEATIESTADGILVTNNNGDLVKSNGKFKEMWRLPEEKEKAFAKNLLWLRYLIEQVKRGADVEKATIELFKQSTEISNNLLYLKDGRIFDHFSKPQYINKKVVGRVWSFREITQEVQTKQRLKAEIVEHEKTGTLLTNSNRELQQFAYITAHNLRSPVANIMGLIDLYDQKNPTEPFNKIIVENLSKASINLDGIVRDLYQIIDIRRAIDNAQQKINIKQSFNRVKDSIIQQVAIAGALIETNFEAAEEIWGVNSYVDSILLNLLTNAIKYRSPIKKLHLKIATKRVGNYVCFTIEDNGLGIDLAKHKEKIFGLYNRFHNHVRGTGMGLYLVKKQIEALGGKIEVSSEKEKGSQFKAYFKAVVIEEVKG